MSWIPQLIPGCEKESEYLGLHLFKKGRSPPPTTLCDMVSHSHTALLVTRQGSHKENDIHQEGIPLEFLLSVMRLGHLLTLHQLHPFVSQSAEGSVGPEHGGLQPPAGLFDQHPNATLSSRSACVVLLSEPDTPGNYSR